MAMSLIQRTASKKGCTQALETGMLVLTQDHNGARIALDEQGTIALRLALESPSEGFTMPVLIEDTVHPQLLSAIQYMAWLLDKIDSKQRLMCVAIAARIAAWDFVGWRTLKQHNASPHHFKKGSERKGLSRRPLLNGCSGVRICGYSG
jgi:hypothetical protein